MTTGPEIVRPALSEDRPALGRLATLALGALVVGLVLANASAHENRWLPRMTHLGQRIVVATLSRPAEVAPTGEGPRSEGVVGARSAFAAGASALSAAPTPTPTTARAAAEAPTGPATEGDAVAAAPTPGAEGPPAPNSEERRGGRHRIEVTPGRVAYLRCDGAPEQDGLFPCPRDRALEERAFGAIAGLATCRELTAAAPTPGRADAWLIFHGPELRGIRMRESPGTPEVSETIRVCLESRLTGLRSRVESDRMTVSFRFDLR